MGGDSPIESEDTNGLGPRYWSCPTDCTYGPMLRQSGHSDLSDRFVPGPQPGFRSLLAVSSSFSLDSGIPSRDTRSIENRGSP